MLLKSVTNGEYRTEIRALFSEYLHWVVVEMNQRWKPGMKEARGRSIHRWRYANAEPNVAAKRPFLLGKG